MSYISTGSEWNFELLRLYDQHIAAIAEEFKLDTYPNQIEVITAEQMMDAYAAVGMPVGYSHWSFGKQFLTIEKNYKRGHMGLAYELVINSNPCIAYLMEENTMPMQALVIAHACYGHNSFFKNNYLFKSWTSADSIIDYLIFAKNYIEQCEEKYGIDKVEELLDTCHALMNYGVDKYKRPQKLTLAEEELRQQNRQEYLQSQVNELWKTLPSKGKDKKNKNIRFPTEPEENILYFLEKNAPLLQNWQREIIRIVRKISQYFYPQRQTKVMNEGWATFWHYTLLQELFNRKLINHAFMLECLHNHTDVILQPGFDNPHFSGINPYALGFAIYQDIRRICEQPTAEDKYWFPNLVNTNWVDSIQFAMRNFKDESFIGQFLSPKVIRDLKLFALIDDEKKSELEVSYIHNEQSYRKIRELLSKQYNLSYTEPNIQVFNVDKDGDRSISLNYYQQDKRPLELKNAKEVIKHLHRAWGFNTKLYMVTVDGKSELTYQCPEETKQIIAK